MYNFDNVLTQVPFSLLFFPVPSLLPFSVSPFLSHALILTSCAFLFLSILIVLFYITKNLSLSLSSFCLFYLYVCVCLSLSPFLSTFVPFNYVVSFYLFVLPSPLFISTAPFFHFPYIRSSFILSTSITSFYVFPHFLLAPPLTLHFQTLSLHPFAVHSFFLFHHFSFVNALRSSSYSPSLNLFCFLPPSFLPSAHARLFSSLTLVTLTTTPPCLPP